MSHFGIAVFTKTNSENEVDKLLEKYYEGNEDYFAVEDDGGYSLDEVVELMKEDHPEWNVPSEFNDKFLEYLEEYLDEQGWSYDGNCDLYGEVYNPYTRYDWYDTCGRFFFYNEKNERVYHCLATELDTEKFRAIDFVDENGEWHDNGLDSTYWFQKPEDDQYKEAREKLKEAQKQGLYVWCVDCHI